LVKKLSLDFFSAMISEHIIKKADYICHGCKNMVSQKCRFYSAILYILESFSNST